MLNVLGEDDDFRTGIWRFPISRGDIVVLSSDGVARALPESAILEESARPDRRFPTLAGRLVTRAAKAGAKDDLTAVTLKFYST